MKSSHPPTSSFPTPLLHVRQKGKKREESGREGGVRAEDLMRGASAEELLAQSLSSSLLEEKEESKRCVCVPFLGLPSPHSHPHSPQEETGKSRQPMPGRGRRAGKG